MHKLNLLIIHVKVNYIILKQILILS